ncbi:MAG: hypothetical protein LLG42_15595 [Chloroflexi bacterium]|nr:hypothetical protein [Chloroflexota bacterium]
MMGKPELMLLDEPTSGLDPLMQQEVYKLILEAQAQGTTICCCHPPKWRAVWPGSFWLQTIC